MTKLWKSVFFLIPPLFYYFSTCRSIGFGDTALLINDMYRLGLSAHVNNHPLSVFTGWIFINLLPFPEIAFRANFVSVFFGSLTVCTFYLLVLFEFGSLPTAIFASLLLMLSHSMWWHSTLVENYAATAFLSVLCLFLWRIFEKKKEEHYLYALCVIAGFGLFNHIQMSFVCIGVLITALIHAHRSLSWRHTVGLCALSAACGLLPWAFLLLRDASSTGSLASAIKGAFVGSFSNTFFSGNLVPSIYDTAYLFWFQSPSFYLLSFGLLGICIALKQEQMSASLVGILTAFLLNTLNFTFYATWDKFAFLLESFVIFSFFAAWTLSRAFALSAQHSAGRIAIYAFLATSIFLPPYLYSNIATWAKNGESIWHQRYHNLYSANTYSQSEYIVNPNKRNFDDVEVFARLLFQKLPANAIFVDFDSRSYYPLAEYFQKYYQQRPDVAFQLANSWGIENWGLSRDALAEIIFQSHNQNKPLFAISLSSPLFEALQAAKLKEPGIEFEKYPLNEERWVYRLLTKQDRIQQFSTDASIPDGVKTLELSAAAGYIDLEVKHIAFLNNAEAVLQSMQSFPGKWHSNDQLFLSAEKPGSAVEFLLDSKDSRHVDLTFHFTAGPDFGIINIEVMPVVAQARLDLYATLVENRIFTLPNVLLSSGINRIRISVSDKALEASGYRIGIDGIEYRKH